jgi:hypothetical protein
MNEADGQESGQRGDTAEMTSAEKVGFWAALILAVALGALPIVGLLTLDFRGQLYRLWSQPSGWEVPLLVLSAPLALWVIPAIAFFRMYRRKRRTGKLLPSGDELLAKRQRRKKPRRLWIRVLNAVLNLALTMLFVTEALGDAHGRAVAWIGATLFALCAAFSTIEVFVPPVGMSGWRRLQRREGFRCPGCDEAPPVGSLWKCKECGKAFDTFESRARCPNCSTFHSETECPNCNAWNPMKEWEERASSAENESARVAPAT